MAFFSKYPYQDNHELNLDWCIAKIRQMEIDWDEFKAVNTITVGGVWDITKAYAKYTIVDDGNYGYLSIKPVPAGILITNTEYWMKVADYSGMIVALQARVAALEATVGDNTSGLVKDMNDAQSDITNIQGDITTIQGDITNLNTAISRMNLISGTIVCIGDSYLEGYNPGGSNVTGWGDTLRSMLGKASNKMKSYYKGGTGFCATQGGENFITLVGTAAADATIDNDDVTLVLFGGGWNDKGYTAAQLSTAITSALNAVASNFPNARAMFAYMAWDENSGNFTVYNKLYLPDRYAQATAGTKMIYLESIYQALQFRNYLFNDGTHPNSNGQKAIASALMSALLGSYSPGTIENLQANNGKQLYFSASEHECSFLFYANYPLVLGSTIASYYCNGSTKVGEIDLHALGFNISPGSDYSTGQLNGYLKGDGGYYDVTLSCRITAAGSLELYATAINDAHSNYLSVTNVTDVNIYPGTIRIPRIYC